MDFLAGVFSLAIFVSAFTFSHESAAFYPSDRKLLEEWERYGQIQERGGWPVILPGTVLEKGDRDFRVPLLRERLWQTGELRETVLNDKKVWDPMFDSQLEEALMRFQVNQGFPPSGKLDTVTLLALNVPVEERLKAIMANLERSMLTLRPSESKYVLVDIASFKVQLFEEGVSTLTLRAIVGEKGLETPVFHSKIYAIVLNPWWDIPRSIATEELLNDYHDDPTLPVEDKLQVFQVRGGRRSAVDASRVDWKHLSVKDFHFELREPPGPENPLGRIKFLIPDPYAVLLHGTPYKEDFDPPIRAISHGCARVERPIELALKLLRAQDPRWTEDRIKLLLGRRRTITLGLKAPVPVYFSYRTAWASSSGVHFRPDVYGWDEKDRRRFVIRERLFPSSPVVLRLP